MLFNNKKYNNWEVCYFKTFGEWIIIFMMEILRWQGRKYALGNFSKVINIKQWLANLIVCILDIYYRF